jgi:dihydrodipicolinate synthase/N-acetylneuraminate lyase
MGEKTFRVLTTAEFVALTPEERMEYLHAAIEAMNALKGQLSAQLAIEQAVVEGKPRPQDR